MPLDNLVIVRHAARLDSQDPAWKHRSPTPYDTPLAEVGFTQAKATAETIHSNLRQSSIQSPRQLIAIHCSPFMRCVQTGLTLAKTLAQYNDVVLRVDAFLGEWQTPDYFEDITPPPNDNHESLQASSLAWAAQQPLKTGSVKIDFSWPLAKLGNAGDYGESWSVMYSRFKHGLDNLVSYYDREDKSRTVILVTHGAGCNPLLGSRLRTPVLFTMGLASFCMLKRHQKEEKEWTLVSVSNDLNALLEEHDLPHGLRHNSISYTPITHDSGMNPYKIYMPEATFNITARPRTKSLSVPQVPDLLDSTSTSTSCSSVVDFFSSDAQVHQDAEHAVPISVSPHVSIHSTSPNYHGPFATCNQNTLKITSPQQLLKQNLTPLLSAQQFQAKVVAPSRNSASYTSTSSGMTTPTSSLLTAFKYSSGATTPTAAQSNVFTVPVSASTSYTPVSAAVEDEDSFFFLGSNQC